MALILALAAGLTGLFILNRLPKARLPNRIMQVLFLFNLLLLLAITFSYVRFHSADFLPDRFLPLAVAGMLILMVPLKLAFLYQLLLLTLDLARVKSAKEIQKPLRALASGIFLLFLTVALLELFFSSEMQVSLFLQTLLEPGVIGLAIAMAIWIWVSAGRRPIRGQRDALRLFAAITGSTFLAVLVSFLAGSLVNDFAGFPLLNASLMFLYNIAVVAWTVRFSAAVEPEVATSRNGNSFPDLLVTYEISRREAEIVELICQGKTNSEIAEALFISLQTVKDHNYNVFRKTGVKNRVQLTNLFSRSL